MTTQEREDYWRDFYAGLEESLREHPTNCPDCGESLLLHPLSKGLLLGWIDYCPECGWKAEKREAV